MLQHVDAAGSGERPRPGRPRDGALDDRILRAAIDLIDAGEDVTVASVVSKSGVSRAALYRRWPSLAGLTAAALDEGRSSYPDVVIGEGMRESIAESLLPRFGTPHGSARDYPSRRLTQRFKLMAADPELRRTYWESHVQRRREPLEAALRDAVTRGQLRADLNVEAAIDALAGAVYYQLLVRGDDFSRADTHARVQASFDLIWCGMLPRD